jgi:ribonuclease HII
MLKSCYINGTIEAGCDEAGRGCLAGPVVAAAVILPPGYQNNELNDSKRLYYLIREKLAQQVKEDAVSWGIGMVNNEEIDELNILKASWLAMHRAIDKLKTKPEILLIDGNRFLKYKDIRHYCIVKGDGIYQSIAAASILAKTFRDAYMKKLDIDFPGYNWKNNKGYPTKEHKLAIRKFGVSSYHRKSFNLNEQLKMGF